VPISPEQSRAARALLGWSQEDLEKYSRVAKKTIADFERGAQIPYARTLKDIEEALEVGGVVFIPEDGGGVGVRRREAIPRLRRRRISRFDEIATFVMSYRGQEFRVQFPTLILDDLDRTDHQTEADYEQSFDRRLNRILSTAAKAIDAGRATAGELILRGADFESAAG
jgi:transcriptional regulator with XRE-family HTH domain